MTAPLPIHTPELFAQALAQAVALLRAGEVVALPTETVYGLAANAFNPAAVAKIFALKGRPAHNPVIVHVADAALARQCVATWPEAATRLAQQFWPGPLTLVLPRSPLIPDLVTAGGATVGVRWPRHPFMQAVIQACGFPLAAPSANVSNALSPTTAAHVQKQLGAALPLIVDGGPAQVGIESTVVDLTSVPPQVLRPGMISAAVLQAALGGADSPGGSATAPPAAAGPLRSPGQLKKHYAPRAQLRVLAWRDEAELRAQLSPAELAAGAIHLLAHTQIPQTNNGWTLEVLPREPAALAQALYAALHRCDDAGAKLIVVEALPAAPDWLAVRDRLSRAAAD